MAVNATAIPALVAGITWMGACDVPQLCNLRRAQGLMVVRMVPVRALAPGTRAMKKEGIAQLLLSQAVIQRFVETRR